MDTKKLGQRINSALAMREMKQKELAEILNVTDNTISYFCSGSRTPKVEQIIKISETLNVSTDYLLGFTDDWHRDPAAVDELGLPPSAIAWLRNLTEKYHGGKIVGDIFTSESFRMLVHKICDYYVARLAEYNFRRVYVAHFPEKNDYEATKEQYYEFISDAFSDEIIPAFGDTVPDAFRALVDLYRLDEYSHPSSRLKKGDLGDVSLSELAEHRAGKCMTWLTEDIDEMAKTRYEEITGLKVPD